MYPRKAFTLVELLIVVLILGALAAIAIPRISQSAHTAKVNACKTNVDIINTQLEIYYAETGKWPTLLVWFVNNCPNYFPDGLPQCPFGTTYTKDGDTHRVRDHTH